MERKELKNSVFRYFSGKTDYKEESEIFKYLDSEHGGNEILKGLEQEWFEQYSRTPEKKAAFVNLMKRIRHKRRVQILKITTSVAAAIIAIAGIFWYTELYPTEKEYYVFNTENGEKVCITLPDSSKVWLNSNSDLRYHESRFGRKRKVELCGEAYFDVRKNEKKPFIVYASDASVTVTGTEFDVRTEADGNVSTALVSGKVIFEIDGESVDMSPGEVVRYLAKDKSLDRQKTDLRSYVDWVEMKLDYPEISVVTLFERLEMIYGIDIDYIPRKYANKSFRIILNDKESIEDVLDAISVIIPIKYQRTENSIIVEETDN